jgi:isocitrate/isopropylmalate dehydrogenase
MHIAPIPGDGTWPEAPAESVKVVKAACAKQGVKLNYPDQMLIGLHDVQ